MNYKKPYNISEELLDRIISVAYGSASFLEKRRIKKMASENETVQQLLNEYKSTSNAVHSIKKEKYSGELKNKTIQESSKSIFDDIYYVMIAKPVISTVATILLIFAITFSLFKNRELTYDGFSISEIQKAHIEAKEALSIVNSIFSKTEKQIKYDILTKEVSKPIKDGMSTVNKLFKKEKNDES